jgi:hypothetical protein
MGASSVVIAPQAYPRLEVAVAIFPRKKSLSLPGKPRECIGADRSLLVQKGVCAEAGKVTGDVYSIE